jgi:cell division protein YceG involved in septum cleavage
MKKLLSAIVALTAFIALFASMATAKTADRANPAAVSSSGVVARNTVNFPVGQEIGSVATGTALELVNAPDCTETCTRTWTKDGNFVSGAASFNDTASAGDHVYTLNIQETHRGVVSINSTKSITVTGT